MNKTIINGIDVSECPLFDKNTGCYHTFNGECVKDSCAVYKWLLEYKRLQEENEELKKQIDIYKNSIIANHDRAIGKRLMEVLLALEEIKKWATNHNPCDIEANINCTKEDCFECLNYDITKITKIINEVLNDN